jgi:hypothetical protein
VAEVRPRGQLDPRKEWAKAEAAARRTRWEDDLAWQIKARKLPTPEREYVFHSSRAWRFDFCWPAFRVAVEVEGLVYGGGRHQRPGGYGGDLDKYNAAALAGWCLLRYDQVRVRSGYAVTEIEHALAARRQP